MPLSPLASVVVKAAGQQGDLQEQIRLLISLISQPLQWLQFLLEGSGGGVIGLGRFTGEGTLAGHQSCLAPTPVVDPHDLATFASALVIIPRMSS
jgi:hypothetical protein